MATDKMADKRRDSLFNDQGDLSDAGTANGDSQLSSRRSDLLGSTTLPLWDDSRLPKLPDYFQQRSGGFISNALRQSVLWDICRRKLQDFDPLLIDAPLEESRILYSAPDESWDALVDRLQAQVDRLAQGPIFDVEQFDRIGTTITALRAVNAERHKAWMEVFFRRLKDHCKGIPSLNAMTIDIEVLQHACAGSDMLPARMREILFSLSNTIEHSSADYIKTFEVIRNKESLLTSLTSSISAVSLKERQEFRRREKSCSDELNGLRLQLLEIESTLSQALNDCLSALPEPRHLQTYEPNAGQGPNSSEAMVEIPAASPATQVPGPISGPFYSTTDEDQLADDRPELTLCEDRPLNAESDQLTPDTETLPSAIFVDSLLDDRQIHDIYIDRLSPETTHQTVPPQVEISLVDAPPSSTPNSTQPAGQPEVDIFTSPLRQSIGTDDLSSAVDTSTAIDIVDPANLHSEGTSVEIAQQAPAIEIETQAEEAPAELLTDSNQVTDKPEIEAFSLSLHTQLLDRGEPEPEQIRDTPPVILEPDLDNGSHATEAASHSPTPVEFEIESEKLSILIEGSSFDITLPDACRTGEPFAVPDGLQSTNKKELDSISESMPRVGTSPSALLSNLNQISAWLHTEDWAALGHLQWNWLEQRQPLRASLLADVIEANLHKHDPKLIDSNIDLPIHSFLPSWACCLLISISDPQLPWLEDKIDSLNRVGSLSDEYKELVVLWITASLLEGLTSKPLQAVRSVSPSHYALQPGSLAHFCAEHILLPIHNTKDLSAIAHDYDQAVIGAREILQPIYNNFQNPSAKSYWRKLIDPDGLLGRIITNTEHRLFPSPPPMIEEQIKSAPEWTVIDAISRRDILNRVSDFSRLIAIARAAHIATLEGSNAGPLAISQQSVDLIINSIQRNGSGGWWLEAIKVGVSTL
jgi:hypothetical protein